MVQLEIIKKYRIQLWILTILGILIVYYFTPLFEVKPKTKCHGFYGLTENPAGAQIQPLCGSLIYGSDMTKPNFPYREKSNYRIEFCRKNIKNVEKYCNTKVDEVLLDDELFVFGGRFKCEYIAFDAENSLKDIFTITSYHRDLINDIPAMVEAYKDVWWALKTYISQFEKENEVSEWHSIKSNLPYGQCQDLKENIEK